MANSTSSKVDIPVDKITFLFIEPKSDKYGYICDFTRGILIVFSFNFLSRFILFISKGDDKKFNYIFYILQLIHNDPQHLIHIFF